MITIELLMRKEGEYDCGFNQKDKRDQTGNG